MKSRRFVKLLGPIIAALAAVAVMAPMAQAATPAPGYSQFAGCPSPEEKAGIDLCIRSVITGGNFKMGNKNVPIENPITLSGGVNENLENFSANSKGGMSLVKQKVPGGIIGLTGLTWLLEFFGSEALTLYAQTEPAGLPTFADLRNISLPIRVKLIHSVLGNNCYVGTFTNPIKLNLTTLTTSPPPPNEPITGKEPGFVFDSSTEILTLPKGEYVDNSFAAPGASGCVLTLFGFIPISINGLVNSQSGLPSAAGNNETRQNNDTEIVGRPLVYP